jgi:diaminohydroxyphosphoribosylaminopyrimidine deaminase/5-amino-6-(5-phosphoribosylamino)uracil reductase
MRSDNDIIFMKRALELAQNAAGSTRPNPMVGAVVVHNNIIIGEGYHVKAGEDHAEVRAVNSAAGDLLRESTIYVTLEPCSHHGRTPPCADMIVQKGIGRVVIGSKDTSSKVSGRGIDILRKGGCDVEVGLLENECRELNRRFFTLHEKGRPYIILKWAETKDGFIDRINDRPDLSGPNWITGEEEKVLVHKWRSQEHSILVGRNTLVKDNPSLTTRMWDGINPVRIVLSASGNLPETLTVLNDNEALLLFSEEKINLRDNKKCIVIRNRENAIEEILAELAVREIQSVMVEGGASVLNQFISKNLWDEARIFTGKSEFGSGIKSPLIKGLKTGEQTFKSSRLIYLKNRLIT